MYVRLDQLSGKTMTKVAILGCMGRMGQTLTEAVIADGTLTLVMGGEVGGHPAIGETVPGTSAMITDSVTDLFASADIVIDFTPPGATADNAARAAATGTKLVVGTTGLSAADEKALSDAGAHTAIMQAGNYSLGVNLLMALTEQASARLGKGWDIEILEMHHKHKVDAPSGTALMLGEAAAKGRGNSLEEVRTPVRDGITGEREDGSIGFAALRGGSVVGEHSVIIASGSERLVLSHRAENRGLFAEGAVKAAVWLAGQPAGRYSMRDVLSL